MVGTSIKMDPGIPIEKWWEHAGNCGKKMAKRWEEHEKQIGILLKLREDMGTIMKKKHGGLNQDGDVIGIMAGM